MPWRRTYWSVARLRMGLAAFPLPSRSRQFLELLLAVLLPADARS